MTHTKSDPKPEVLPSQAAPAMPEASVAAERLTPSITERRTQEVRSLLLASQRALAQADGSRALLNIAENGRSLSLTPECSPDQLISALLSSTPIPLVARGPRTISVSGQELSFRTGRSELADSLSELSQESQSLKSEHGTHALFLSLGSVRWTVRGEAREGPLVLIPVTLQWNRSTGGWEVCGGAGDVEMNPALREHLSSSFGINLPDISSQEEFTFAHYAAEITKELTKSGAQVSFDQQRTTLGLYYSGSLALQRDLDPKNWPSSRDPSQHRFLRALVDGSLRHETPASAPFIESSRNRHWVLNADSSQQAVLAKVQSGAPVLVQGPPGSGKSTTIVNMTAQALAEGKRVLIVSEKADALKVAKHWLDYAGIGDTALLIEPGYSRKALNEELRRTLALGRPSQPQRDQAALAFDRALSVFSSRPTQLAQPVGKSGMSLYEVLSRAAADQAHEVEQPTLKDPSMLAWTSEKLAQAKNLCQRLEAIYAAHGHPRELPPCNAGASSKGDSQTLSSASGQAHAAVVSYLAEVTALFGSLGLEVPIHEKHLDSALKSLRTIDRLFSENGALVTGVSLNYLSSAAQEQKYLTALQRQRQLADTFEKSKGVINFGNLAVADLARIASGIAAHEKKFLKFFDGDYTYAIESLHRITQVPKSLTEQKELLKRLIEIKELLLQRDSDNSSFSELLGEGWDSERPLLGEVRFWQRTSQLVHALVSFSKEARQLPNFSSYVPLLKNPSGVYAVSDQINSALLLAEGYTRERQALFENLGRADKSDLATFSSSPLSDQETRLSVWRFHPEGFEAAKAYAILKQEAKALGISEVLESAETSGSLSGISVALERGYYQLLAERLARPTPVVTSFDPEKLRRERQDLQTTHARLQQSNAEQIAFQHWQGIPRAEVGGQASALILETQKRSGFLPLRTFLTETSVALQKVKPVMLMSPQTLAKVADPAGLEFDLVIFDEASQVRPHSALGAIARGTQIVIVGDPEQLDPTSFFEKRSDEPRGQPIRSLIDLVENAGMQRDELAWHYRSRFPGLIQPSNEGFYRGRLKSFPSPEKGEGADGFVYRPVANGIYDAGRSRTNRQEAIAIAQAILQHAKSRPHESLGVVALSRPQMEVIQEEVERLRLLNPILNTFLSRETAEPFFVRNLETSQGIERDRIMISIGYARTPEGSLSLNFGPLSAERGPQRLNVLLSRARVACEVFTSLKADEPEFQSSTNKSVQTLNKLLRRMTEESEGQQGVLSSLEPDPFKSMVKRLLEERGYTVHSSFGPEGQGPDLAIMDRHHPRYLLGIFFDAPPANGDTHTENQEIIRRQALTERGWNILDQSVIDWYQDPKKALASLERALVNAALLSAPVQANSAKTSVRKIARSNSAAAPLELTTPYRTASVKLSIGAALRQGDASLAKEELTRAYHDILTTEAPLHTSTMRERLSECAGALKWAQNYDSVVSLVEADVLHSKKVLARGGILYLNPEQNITLRDRSALRGVGKEVPHIPPEEIELAVLKTIEHSLRIRHGELSEAVSKLLGFSKEPSGLDSITGDCLKQLIAQGFVGEQNGFLFSIPQNR
jgi:energy-coupling factor transporter ATP-binding protein EcfA2